MQPSGEISFDENNQPKKDAQKEGYKDDVKNQEKFNNLLNTTNNVLCTISTIFPFKLFPTHIVVEPQKVNIINEEFFLSKETRSVMINDIAEVFVNTDLFFASLTIIDKNFVENKIIVTFLPKRKAISVRNIITGLITTTKQDVDVNKINSSNLADQMREIGQSISP